MSTVKDVFNEALEPEQMLQSIQAIKKNMQQIENELKIQVAQKKQQPAPAQPAPAQAAPAQAAPAQAAPAQAAPAQKPKTTKPY